MKKLTNPWVGMSGYNCIGCCPSNPLGLHLELYEDGEDIQATWQPEGNHQGWIDTLHGGIISMLLDEVAGWVVFRKLQRSGVTVRLNVKFRRQVRVTDGAVTVRAHLVETRRGYATMHCELRDGAGQLCDEAEAVYRVLSEEESVAMHFSPCRAEGEE